MVKRTFSTLRSHWKAALGVVLVLVLALFLTSNLYPAVLLRSKLGIGPAPAVPLEVDRVSKVNPHEVWKVTRNERLSACDNRPGLKMIYVSVRDEKGDPLEGVKIRFDTEPSIGIAYEHLNVWGVTDEDGYLEWQHLGIPTRYRLFMEDDEQPLIKEINTAIGYEYCQPASWPPSGSGWNPGGWRPINRPGIYSFFFEMQVKGAEDQVSP